MRNILVLQCNPDGITAQGQRGRSLCTGHTKEIARAMLIDLAFSEQVICGIHETSKRDGKMIPEIFRVASPSSPSYSEFASQQQGVHSKGKAQMSTPMQTTFPSPARGPLALVTKCVTRRRALSSGRTTHSPLEYKTLTHPTPASGAWNEVAQELGGLEYSQLGRRKMGCCASKFESSYTTTEP